jgi:hypothetical protein
MNKATRERLELTHIGVRTSSIGHHNYSMLFLQAEYIVELEIFTKSLFVYWSEELSNSAAHNINVIGTDFINQVVVIDCFQKKELTIENPKNILKVDNEEILIRIKALKLGELYPKAFLLWKDRDQNLTSIHKANLNKDDDFRTDLLMLI